MNREEWLALLRQQRCIAVIRATEFDQGRRMAAAIAASGLRLIEITWTSDRPSALIAALRAEFPSCVIGAGTLLDVAAVETAVDAGAQFLFSPHTQTALIRAAASANVPIIPGALSPTEIVSAWQAGAASVKVFPVQAVGGSAYIKSLQGPLGSIPLIPTGGVTLENAHEFVQAGAIAIGLASELFPKAAIAAGNWDEVTERARRLLQNLKSLSAGEDAVC